MDQVISPIGAGAQASEDDAKAPLSKAFWWILAGLVGVLYALTYPGNRSETGDAFEFAARVEEGSPQELARFRHFLYLPLMRVLYLGVHAINPSVRSYTVMVIAGAVLAIGSVLLLASIAHSHLGFSRNAVVLTAAALALSHGFWRFSVEAEIYGLGAFTGLLYFWWVAREPTPSPWSWQTVGLSAVAIAANALNLIPVILAVPVFLWASQGWRPAARWLIATSTISVVTMVGIYAAVASAEGGGGVPAIVLDPSKATASILGIGAAVVAHNFLLGYEPFLAVLTRINPQRQFADEAFLGEQMPSWITWFGMVSLVVVLALAVVCVISVRRQGRGHVVPKNRAWKLSLAVWSVAYFLGIAALGPENPEAWILVLIPLWLLIGAAVFEPLTRSLRGFLPVAFVVALGLHNLVGGLLPMKSADGDYNRARAEWFLSNTGQGDLILTSQGAAFKRYVDYYTPADVVDLWDLGRDATAADVIDLLNRRERIFLTQEVRSSPEELRDRGFEVAAQLSEHLQPLADELLEVHEDAFGVIYQLLG